MMAHAFQDPLWKAVMELETLENPDLKGFIEDKCQTCHAPMARTQHRRDTGRVFSYAEGRRSELAVDGVSCTLCHQIQPDRLGQEESFSGRYAINETREIFGPYDDVFAMPMRRHVGYTPRYGAHVQDSALCATCHTLHTPVLAKGRPTAETFPEQVPYLEWKASAYPRANRHCQDCHMPRVEEPVRISTRPPWLEGRQPFWRHSFVGGNTFMLQLIAGQGGAVRPLAGHEVLQTTVERAREQLRRAARLELAWERQGRALVLQVKVINLAGHKFPTGHPYRRAWLHARIHDARGIVVFESGAADATGRLPGTASHRNWSPHWDEIHRPDQVQIYEAAMGDAEGQRTYALLRAAHYLKDNRIPPRGFGAEEIHPDAAVHGAAREDANFNREHSGSDTVSYRVDLGEHDQSWTAAVELLYQAVPPEAVDRLMTSPGKEAKTFIELYKKMNKQPEVVAAAALSYPELK